MCDEVTLERMQDRLDSRIQTVSQSDHPLKPVVHTFLRGKRSGVLTVRGEESHEDVLDGARKALTADLTTPQFVEIMAMMNAIEWATEERDSI